MAGRARWGLKQDLNNKTKHTGTNHEQQERKAATDPVAVRVARSRANRKRLLRAAVPAMRAAYEDGIQPANLHNCLLNYVAARVELAHLTNELGVLDGERIAEIAALFSVDLRGVEFLWFAAKSSAEGAFERGLALAQGRLEAGELAIVANHELVDLKEASRVFEMTKERKARLFGPKLITPSRRDERGGWAKTKSIFTGMPTVQPENDWAVVAAVPDGPGAGRFTTSERKAMAAEFGVKIDTLRAKERDLSEGEFEVWANRRRKTMATRAKNEAERRARMNRRRRKPGKTAAVREYAMRTGMSERTAWTRLKGLSDAEIMALMPRVTLVEITPPARNVSENCSDNEPEIPCDGDAEVKRKVKRCSDSCSDTDPRNPAFLRNSLPDTVAASVSEDGAHKPNRKRRSTTLTVHQRLILGMYLHQVKGCALTNGLLRLWKHRGVLRSRLSEAAEWYAEHESRAVAAGASFTDETQARIDLHAWDAGTMRPM